LIFFCVVIRSGAVRMRMPIRVRTDINTDQLYPENSGLPSQPLDKCLPVPSGIFSDQTWCILESGFSGR
jgi:hypothetical protein